MTNLNFNKNVSINLDFVPKTEKTLEKKRITQAQKITLVLYLLYTLGWVNKYYSIEYTKICTIYNEK